jgi:hypothetical protein
LSSTALVEEGMSAKLEDVTLLIVSLQSGQLFFSAALPSAT